MFLIFVYAISIFIIYIFHFYQKNRQKFSELPPSPDTKPLIGNIDLFYKPKLYKKINEYFRNKFTDYITIWIFHQPVVIVNNYIKLIDLYDKKFPIVTSGRASNSFYDLLSNGYNDIIFSNMDSQWSYNKQLLHSYLVKFSLNIKLNDYVKNSFNIFKSIILNNNNSNGFVNPNHQSYMLSYNIIGATIFGKKFQINDIDFINLQKYNNEIFNFMQNNNLYFYLHYSKYFPLPKITKFINNSNKFSEFIEKQVIKHENTADNNVDSICILDYLLKTKQKLKEKNDVNMIYLNRKNIVQIIQNLYIGSTEIIGTTIYWIIGILATNRGILLKIREEIQNFELINNREIIISDKSNLNYVQAVLNEIYRYTSLLPFGLIHEVTEDFQFDGYLFPKGTKIMANQYEFHHDSKYWTNPNEFRPERFLDNNNELIPDKDGFLPFGCGNRVCLGQSLATDSIFLFLCMICRDFELEWSSEMNEQSNVVFENEFNTQMRYPKQYFVKFIESNENS